MSFPPCENFEVTYGHSKVQICMIFPFHAVTIFCMEDGNKQNIFKRSIL